MDYVRIKKQIELRYSAVTGLTGLGERVENQEEIKFEKAGDPDMEEIKDSK